MTAETSRYDATRAVRPALPTHLVPPEPLRESAFLRALRGEPTPHTPVWLMRQAGRTSREYLELRKRLSFLELCESPGDCAEMAVLAQSRLGADAAIVFSDILPIVRPLGFELSYEAGHGPVIGNPVRSAVDVDALAARQVEPRDELPFVMEAVRQTRAALPGNIPLIGFAGAPFTVASYLLEGGKSRNFERTKTFMLGQPGAWSSLLGRLSALTASYLNAQVEAGAQALQVFDSWIGCVSPADYRRCVLPHMRTLFDGLYADVPVIHYGAQSVEMAGAMAEVGADALSIDFRAPLADSWERAGTPAIQGNIDPCALLAPREAMLAQADSVLAEADRRPGHVFNLGGGLLPSTDFDQAIALVAHVHERTQR